MPSRSRPTRWEGAARASSVLTRHGWPKADPCALLNGRRELNPARSNQIRRMLPGPADAILSRALQYLADTARHDLRVARLHHPHGYLDALWRARPQLDRRVAFEQLLGGLGSGNLELAFVPGDAEMRHGV